MPGRRIHSLSKRIYLDEDELGEYTEICVNEGVAPVILNEQQLEDL